MRILIIGSGIAGVVAQRALSNEDIEVVTKSNDSDALAAHSAVMRFRTKELANLLGIHLKEIKLYKQYALGGLLHSEPNITANNCYSIKTHDSLGERSLKDCGVSNRYLFDSAIKPHGNVIRGATLQRICNDLPPGNVAEFSLIDGNVIDFAYDYCISTIPMPTLLKACMIPHDLIFDSEVIHVYTALLKIPSTIHQTIYFPEFGEEPYRITIEGQNIICECMEEASTLPAFIDEYFGIGYHLYGDFQHSTQIGKLKPVDNNKRKAMMVELNKFNIYSLGRHAIWRSIRADHLVGDIEKIKHFITVSEEHKKYESNIDPTYPRCA